jgi:hypothetical protein
MAMVTIQFDDGTSAIWDVSDYVAAWVEGELQGYINDE